ncbi:hypothetical protein H1C71_027854, partial [Ictidomys tridecemlineatus]
FLVLKSVNTICGYLGNSPDHPRKDWLLEVSGRSSHTELACFLSAAGPRLPSCFVWMKDSFLPEFLPYIQAEYTHLLLLDPTLCQHYFFLGHISEYSLCAQVSI